jgi:Enoyl-CoA hydratase/isomerase
MRRGLAPECSGAVQIALHDDLPSLGELPADRLASLPVVIIGVAHGAVAESWRDLCDVVVEAGDEALADIEANVNRHPITAATLALLLRGQARRSVGDGLVAESAAYSVLQAGPEFAAWREAHPVRSDRDAGARVTVAREGDVLHITLTRPRRLNALDAQMRDELVEALGVAAADTGIRRIVLRGEGAAFCAGGDLDEFGSRADPASAHLIRLERSVARALFDLSAETVTWVHGATVGSGIELAACTGTVVAAPDTQIALPEIGLGLVPGAGGTVSLTRRIGRLRTAWLAFSGRAVDAGTALDWGLVDEVAP